VLKAIKGRQDIKNAALTAQIMRCEDNHCYIRHQYHLSKITENRVRTANFLSKNQSKHHTEELRHITAQSNIIKQTKIIIIVIINSNKYCMIEMFNQSCSFHAKRNLILAALCCQIKMFYF
jgi:hypothetical protein